MVEFICENMLLMGVIMFNLNEGLLDFLFPEGYSLFIHFGCLLLVLLISYFLGSINSAIIISKVMYHEDIRTKGSGNAGMTNIQRTYGNGAAALTLVGDISKTVIAVFITGFFFGFGYVSGISVQGYCYVAGLFAVIGHIFPVYYGFKGGKGVLATATMALVLTPIPFLILFLLFVCIVAMSKYISLGSVSVAVLYPVLLRGTFAVVFTTSMPFLTALSTIILAVLIVWCHRENLKRIGNKTERQFSFKKKNKEE